MNPVLYGLLGLALLVIGWLLGSLRRPGPEDDQLTKELRDQLKQRDSDLTQVRDQLREAMVTCASAEAKRTSAEHALTDHIQRVSVLEADFASLRTTLNEKASELATSLAQLAAEQAARAALQAQHQAALGSADNLQHDLLSLKRVNGELSAEATFLKERLATQRQDIEALQTKFQKDFEAISNKLLVDNTSQFNRQSAESLDKLLAPLKDELKDFKTKLETSQRETATHSALLKDQIGRIGAEAANLSRALKGDVKVLGNWGENMLDQILGKSGLQLGVHYRRQSGARDEEGDQRFLDVIVDLPDNQHLIIDSKVSLKRYEDHVNCNDDQLRLGLLQEHVLSIRNHFRGLGAKRYQEIHGINTPDFVLMYIPIEPAFFVAVAHDPGLFSEALDKNVVLITNSTLLATLRTVANVWRLADQQKNALEIADRGGRLYDKFVGFIADLQDLGSALKKSQEAWEAASNKLHTGTGNLVRQAEQLKALGVKASKSMPTQLKTLSETENSERLLPLDNGHTLAPAHNPTGL